VTRGAVACGHPATAAAALEILQDGGNAFDAALAALCAATAVEPVLCSLGGGGFLMARPAGEAPRLYDFFVATPYARRPLAELDFYPIHADFGTATQEFHIGIGAIATPGTVKGLFAVHRALARLPMARIVEPAARLARDGVPLRAVDAYLFRVVGAILTARADSRAAFTRPDGTLLREGDRFRLPALADSLEALAAEGEALFYRGALGQALLALCRDGGGLLTEQDLASYRVVVRRPLARRYRDTTIHLNPPPSTGGLLIAFALALLAQEPAPERGSSAEVALLTRATRRVRSRRCSTRPWSRSIATRSRGGPGRNAGPPTSASPTPTATSPPSPCRTARAAATSSRAAGSS